MQIWSFIAKQLKNKKTLCLLVVVESLGSSPGRQSFKMVVSDHGELNGSIGGGFMEHKLVELAKSLLSTGAFKPFIKRQIHRKEDRKDRSGMICSGEQSIAFYHLNPTDIPWIEKLALDPTNEAQHLVRYDQEGIHLIPKNSSFKQLGFLKKESDTWTFIEQPGLKNTVYIIGAGHVGLALSKTMNDLGFRVKIFDDREGLNTLEQNHHAHQKQVIAYEDVADWIEEGDNNYLVLMSFGYRKDELILRKLLGKKLKYFGVMGSAHKMKVLLASLQADGFSSELLNQLHTPIGLSIHSQTPQEIAISIAAEIIKIKNTP